MSIQTLFLNPNAYSGLSIPVLNSPYTVGPQLQSAVMFAQQNQKPATTNQTLWPNQTQQLVWNVPQGNIPIAMQPNQVLQQQVPQITFGVQQQQPSVVLQQQSNPFGQQQPSIFGQQQPSIFGQQQPSVFGQQQPSVFGQSQPSVFGQSQPSVFGQSQPSVFGQSQPSVFGQSQPSVFGQSQPSVFGQPQISPFGQQQPSVFGQQQPQTSNAFGQPTTFVQPVQVISQPNNWSLPQNFCQQPQLLQQGVMFVPTNQNVQQVPQQFFQNGAQPAQQLIVTQVVDQNGQVSLVPVAVVYNNFNGPTAATLTDNASQTNNIGMLPAAKLHAEIRGRSPSLFSTDPAFDSPLYTWKRKSSNWKRYPDGLNSSIASTFIDPPGLWTLPSAASYLPKRPSTATDQNNSINYLPTSIFEERDMAFHHWNNALKRTPSTETVKKRQFLHNADTYQRFKSAYGDDEMFRNYPEGSFSSPLKRDDDDPKRLNPELVRQLESLRGPRKRANLSHPSSSYQLGLGQQYFLSRDEDHLKPRGPTNIDLVRNSDTRGSPDHSGGLGLFDQPTPGKIPWYLKTPPAGPPKDNSFEYCSQDPWLTRQKIYNQLEKESTKDKFATRLPKSVYRNQTTPNESPRSRPRYWSEPMESPEHVRTPARRPPPPRNFPPPRPTTPTITLNRPGYYCIPNNATLKCCVDRKGQCIVEDFEVGHKSFGKIVFPGVTNVAGLNLDKIVHFEHKSFVIYPEDKPPYGEGLHREAIVTLFNVYPVLKDSGLVVRDPKTIEDLRYANLLRQACHRFDGSFIGYDSHNGLWVFKIQSPPKK